MAKNTKTYIKLVDTSPRHPKVVDLSDAAFRVWITLMCESADDGGLVTKAKFESLPAAIQSEIESLIEDDLTIFGMAGYRTGPKRRRPIPQSVRVEVFERDGWRCLTCGDLEDLTVDHIHPVARGGSDELSNFQTLCRRCNSRKGVSVSG